MPRSFMVNTAATFNGPLLFTAKLGSTGSEGGAVGSTTVTTV